MRRNHRRIWLSLTAPMDAWLVVSALHACPQLRHANFLAGCGEILTGVMAMLVHGFAALTDTLRS